MTDFPKNYASASPLIQWPALVASDTAQLYALLYQFEQSQWWSIEELQSTQQKQLKLLLQHAKEYTPYYKQLFKGRSVNKLIKYWHEIPLLTRETLQSEAAQIRSKTSPKELGVTRTIQTSGSTGIPISVSWNATNNLFWKALTLREHIWHQRNSLGNFASIRPDRKLGEKKYVDQPDWGPPISQIFDTGRSSILDSRVDIEKQVKWLIKRNPSTLLSLPSNLQALSKYMQANNTNLPALENVITYGEVLEQHTRNAIQQAWHVPVTDIYSAQEVGYIALQCPDNPDNYHIQSESLLVEILDDNNQPCSEGKTGRVVITTLHGYSMPLIRYANQDYAEVGGLCSCGRGLPVIKNIKGRQRNMAFSPDGKQYWPSFPAEKWSHIKKIRQIQLRQTSLETIRVCYFGDAALSTDEEREFSQLLNDSLGHAYHFSFEQLTDLPRGKNGKYEDFICEISPKAN